MKKMKLTTPSAMIFKEGIPTVLHTKPFSQLLISLFCLALLTGVPVQVLADDLALVVGIDRYQYGTDNRIPGSDEIRNLQGAGNDAKRIARALRSVGVALPDSRLLLNERATLSAFKIAWQSMIDESLPGDNIIVTFAGHGGQEKEQFDPIDEAGDKLDETLMFWDFDPRAPYKGRLLDDELFQMFKRASDRQIMFVADSCRSAGLTRSVNNEHAGRSRAGGTWDLGASSDLSELVTIDAAEGDDWAALDHVTYLTGTDNEALAINEVLLDGVAHGALSVSFAEGMEGLADTNNDNVVRRDELANYISVRVSAIANQMQTPGFTPRGALADNLALISLPQSTDTATFNATAVSQYPLAVSFSGMSMPSGLSHAKTSDNANLHIERRSSETIAYYGADEITRWENSGSSETQVQRIQMLIDKYRLLETIDASYNTRQVPVDLSVSDCLYKLERKHCNYRHSVGEMITIDVNQLNTNSASTANGRYFVLFNLAGEGRLQLMYPTLENDLPRLNKLPLQLGLRVEPPVGREDLVAVFCKDDPSRFKATLKGNDQKNALPPHIFRENLAGYDCQMNRLSVFTGL